MHRCLYEQFLSRDPSSPIPASTPLGFRTKELLTHAPHTIRSDIARAHSELNVLLAEAHALSPRDQPVNFSFRLERYYQERWVALAATYDRVFGKWMPVVFDESLPSPQEPQLDADVSETLRQIRDSGYLVRVEPRISGAGEEALVVYALHKTTGELYMVSASPLPDELSNAVSYLFIKTTVHDIRTDSASEDEAE